MSLYRVAVAFGRDRLTVAYACHLIEDQRDPAIRAAPTLRLKLDREAA
jgi:hypothetical protein